MNKKLLKIICISIYYLQTIYNSQTLSSQIRLVDKLTNPSEMLSKQKGLLNCLYVPLSSKAKYKIFSPLHKTLKLNISPSFQSICFSK